MSSVSEDQPSFPKGSKALTKDLMQNAAFYIVASLHESLIRKGETKEKAYELMSELVGQLKREGYFTYDTVEAAILYSLDYVKEQQQRRSLMLRPGGLRIGMAYDAIQSLMWSLCSPAWQVVNSGKTDDPNMFKGYDPKEIALVKKLSAAERAYYEIRSEYDKYFSLKAITVIREFITFYAECIAKVNNDWITQFNKELSMEEAFYKREARDAADEGR